MFWTGTHYGMHWSDTSTSFYLTEQSMDYYSLVIVLTCTTGTQEDNHTANDACRVSQTHYSASIEIGVCFKTPTSTAVFPHSSSLDAVAREDKIVYKTPPSSHTLSPHGSQITQTQLNTEGSPALGDARGQYSGIGHLRAVPQTKLPPAARTFV